MLTYSFLYDLTQKIRRPVWLSLFNNRIGDSRL